MGLGVKVEIAALVLAAGLSRRMGQPKPLLDWGGRTVLEHILAQLQAGSITDIRVITGAYADALTQIAQRMGATVIHNRDYATGEMLSSLQAGLRALVDTQVSAALITLGDQPMIRAENVHTVLAAYAGGDKGIVAPSHNLRRGHPILIDRRYWDELLALPAGSAPRDAINRHTDDTAYVDADESVLGDIDTPEAYAEARREAELPEIEISNVSRIE
jgi:molybdenum cofactor cytidylyltransferase